MKLSDLRSHVVDDIDAGISVELLSAPGRGKSEFAEDLVAYLSQRDEQEWGFSKAFLATYTPPDLLGYQFKGERDWTELGMGRVTVTDPSMPLWMMTVTGKPVCAYKRGILLLDEYGQAEGDVKRSSAELFLHKRLGPWALPPGWGVIACSNRQGDRSGVTKSFDFVINRRREYTITDDVPSLLDYMARKGALPLTMAFTDQNPQIVFSNEPPKVQGPWCTPRSVMMLDRSLQLKAARNKGVIPTDSGTVEGASGLVGAGAAAQFFNFVTLDQEMPRYEEIVANPEKVKVPERPDALMLIAFKLASRVADRDAAQVIKYMDRCPKEYSVCFMRGTIARDAQLIKSAAINGWCQRNSHLVMMISKKR